MSTSYQAPDQAMPLLTRIAFRITVAVALLFVTPMLVMFVQKGIAIAFFMAALLGWFVASWCALLGVTQAKPKNKAINVLLFSLFGPLLIILFALLILSLPRFF